MFELSVHTKFYGKQSNINFRRCKRKERYDLNIVSLFNAVWSKTHENKLVWFHYVSRNV